MFVIIFLPRTWKQSSISIFVIKTTTMTDMKYDYKEEDAVHIKHFFFGFPLGGLMEEEV